MGLGMGVRLMLEEALGWRGLLCCGWGCLMLDWGVCFPGTRGGWLLRLVGGGRRDAVVCKSRRQMKRDSQHERDRIFSEMIEHTILIPTSHLCSLFIEFYSLCYKPRRAFEAKPLTLPTSSPLCVPAFTFSLNSSSTLPASTQSTSPSFPPCPTVCTPCPSLPEAIL